MSVFHIEVRPAPGAKIDDPRSISIRAGCAVLTRLLRPNAVVPDDYLKAPPTQLAFWLADNWWRLRWEGLSPAGMTPEWKLAHDVSSIGGGYIWPRCAIWGESDRIGLSTVSDPPGVFGPVRYLTDDFQFVPAVDFEQEVDRFFAEALDDLTGWGSDRAALRGVVDALNTERADPELSDWRRLEARLGFDADEAPEVLMETMLALSDQYGRDGVEEAAMAAPGDDASKLLRTEIAAAESSRFSCKFTEAVTAAGAINHRPVDPPWIAAEHAAQSIRSALAINRGPLRNGPLSDLLSVQKDIFRSAAAPTDNRYGLRLSIRDLQRDKVALRSRGARERRFELARALGDAIWAPTDALGPVTKAVTARQKFQRAFAQSLLCPFEDLMAYIGAERPTEDDVAAAAQHFHVSERMVQSTLVNKHVIRRVQFEDMFEAA